MIQKTFSFSTIFFFLILVNSAFSQEDSKSSTQFGFQLNANVLSPDIPDLIQFDDAVEFQYTNENLLNFAFIVGKKINEKKFYEFQLANLRIQRFEDSNTDITEPIAVPIRGSIINDIAISLRYLRGYNLTKNEESKIQFSILVGPDISYRYISFEPKTSLYFPQKLNEIGLGIAANPRFSYKLNSKITLDLNLIGNPIQLSYLRDRIDNRVLTNVERTQTGFDFEVALNHLDLGLGFRLAL